MKREIAERWIEELRSGRHKQGTGFLDRGGKRCCLGVLCYLAVDEGVIPPPVESSVDDDTGETILEFGGGVRTQLPVAVRDWAGMDSSYGQIPQDDSLSDEALDGLNDELANGEHLYPFTRIADVIEKYTEEL